jgi:hypothetical protein
MCETSGGRTRFVLCGVVVSEETHGYSMYLQTFRPRVSRTLIISVHADADSPSAVDYQNFRGIIFVIDSNAVERIVEACEKLHRMLEADDLKAIHLYWTTNKICLMR